MIVNFAKSLDRPVDIFGVKGKWLIVYILMALAVVFVGIILGVSMGAGIGTAIAIVGVIGSFIVCLVLQGKVSHRRLYKFKATSRIYPCVFRKETLCRILLPGDSVGDCSGNMVESNREENK